MQGLRAEAAFSTSSIRAMRDSGVTLLQIARRIGRTKERVRQILIDSYGSTKHQLISTRQLCKRSGLSRSGVNRLQQNGVIVPAKEWDTSEAHYTLWSQDAVAQIKSYRELYKTFWHCRICQRPIPDGRYRYCSERCYKESHKYKYRSAEARNRHRIRMREYKEKHKIAVCPI